jgi:hypothetical protein
VTTRIGLLTALGGTVTAVAGALMLAYATGASYDPAPVSVDSGDSSSESPPPVPRDVGAVPITAVAPPAAANAPSAIPVAPPSGAQLVSIVLGTAEHDPSWQEVPIAHRNRDLGPLAADVGIGLREARRQMTACFEADPLFSRSLADDPDGRIPHPALLMLHLEEQQGVVEVIDSTVEGRADASPELVECCQRMLRGYRMYAANTVPGRRHRLKYQCLR